MKPLRRLAAGIVAVAVVSGAGACVDRAPTAPGPQPDPPVQPLPPGAAPGVSHLVHVNMVDGTVSVVETGAELRVNTSSAPIWSGAGGGAPSTAQRFFGAPSQLRYHFTVVPGSPMVDPADPTKRIFRLNARIENRLSWAIGAHVSHQLVAPRDTMGIFIYVAIEPHVTLGCQPMTPNCAAEVANHHGTASFSELTQRYWYFREILDASDGVTGSGPDLSLEQEWAFRADAAVENFVFGIAASAPWERPNDGSDTTFRVLYQPDSLPFAGGGSLRTEPVWKLYVANAGSSASAIVTTDCHSGAMQCLRMTTPAQANGAPGRIYVNARRDSLAPDENAWMSAELVTSVPNNTPTVYVGMQDGERLIQVGISGNRLGFTTETGSFSGATYNGNIGSSQILIAKFGRDSVQLWHNGMRRLTRTHASLPTTSVSGPATPVFWFGNGMPPGQALGAVQSNWSLVGYEIGASKPH